MRLLRKAAPAPPLSVRFPSWDALAVHLRTELQQLVVDPARFLVVSIAGTNDFVQWHGNEPGVVYAEASSGYYGGKDNTPEQDGQLTALGWTPPGKDALGTTMRNWRRSWPTGEQPELVDITVRTLHEVYRADISCVEMEGGR